MADLATWANIAEIVGGATVIGGIAYGFAEFRRAGRERRIQGAMRQMEQVRTPEYLRAARIVYELPASAPVSDIMADREVQDACGVVCAGLHEMGTYVRQGVIPWEVVKQGNPWHAYEAWTRLHLFVAAVRGHRPSEWWPFEWMVARLQAEGVVPATPPARPEPFTPGDKATMRPGPADDD